MLIKFKVKKIYPGCWCITYFKTKEKQKSNTCGIKIVFAHTFDITEMKKNYHYKKTFSTMKKNKILISVKLSNIVSHFCTFSINNNNTIDQSSIFVWKQQKKKEIKFKKFNGAFRLYTSKFLSEILIFHEIFTKYFSHSMCRK